MLPYVSGTPAIGIFPHPKKERSLDSGKVIKQYLPFEYIVCGGRQTMIYTETMTAADTEVIFWPVGWIVGGGRLFNKIIISFNKNLH